MWDCIFSTTERGASSCQIAMMNEWVPSTDREEIVKGHSQVLESIIQMWPNYYTQIQHMNVLTYMLPLCVGVLCWYHSEAFAVVQLDI